MSDQLDKKILSAVLGDSLANGMPLPSFVEKIKQAFIDDGWVESDLVSKLDTLMQSAIDESKAKLERASLLSDLMTGQEWYDKFEKALKHELYGDCDTQIMCDGCACDAVEAAKKAAGIN